MKKLRVILLFLFSLSLGLLLNNQESLAVSATDWKPGRIMDDVVFQDKQSMTVAQIQQFIDSKMPSCDTWGTRPMWSGGPTRAQWSADNGRDLAPYTCLKDYVENTTTKANNASDPRIAVPGGLSAAQLIFNASQAQNINPQVYLVLLQKEQSLVTDDWPYAKQFERATGNNCPDTAPCNPQFAWLWTQVNNAGAQFNYYVNNFNQFNYAPGWNNILFHPNASCDRQSVYIENAYTAALYIYTPYVPNQAALNNMYGTGDACSSYGNRNFWRLFNDWFGGTLVDSTNCNAVADNSACVWSLRKADGSQFLTTSRPEMMNAVTAFGWVNEGVVFYGSTSQQQGMTPVYRLRLGGRHYYTSNQIDFTARTSTGGWTNEGVAFYVYPSTLPNNASHRVSVLHRSATDQYYLTINATKKNELLSAGFVLSTESFGTISGLATLTPAPEGRDNVYVLRNGTKYIHTSNIGELDTAIRMGYVFERTLTTFATTTESTPVYRLRSGNGYFYTANNGERQLAVQLYGMFDEGIVYNLDEMSDTIHRLYNSGQNRYYYTESLDELMSMTNRGGWRYEGPLRSPSEAVVPVLRFLNTLTGRHLFTTSTSEAAKITNTNWRYEGRVFSAHATTGDAIYRLRISDRHFFTANLAEKDIAVSTFGYVDEGIAFYTSPTPTNNPIYRLQGSNNQYFYTVSSAERDIAVSRYGFRYEGLGFYGF
jgi:hypothetical protein